MVDQGVTFPGDNAPISRQVHQEMDDLNEMQPDHADNLGDISMDDDFGQMESETFHDPSADELIAKIGAEEPSSTNVDRGNEPMDQASPNIGSGSSEQVDQNMSNQLSPPKAKSQKWPAPPKSKKGFRVLTPSVFNSKEERNAWMDDSKIFSLKTSCKFYFSVFNQEYDRLFHGKKPVYDEAANKARREKHRADLQAVMAKTQLDPNCTKPYKYNPRYFPHHDYTIADKRMAKSLHKCDKNRPYEEQMAEVEEILGRKQKEAFRKKQLKKRRQKINKMNRKLKEAFGDK